MTGVFKIKKDQRRKSGTRITEYGDEKILLEGDCYKPATAASPFYRGKLERFKVENLSGIHFLLCPGSPVHISGCSLTILTGRSSDFQVTPLNSGDIQEINLQPSSEKTLRFCMVRRETKLACGMKEYQADVYCLDVGQGEQERLIMILRTSTGLQVSRIRSKDNDQGDHEAPEMKKKNLQVDNRRHKENDQKRLRDPKRDKDTVQQDLETAEMIKEDADVEILSPLVVGKIYSDRERVTADNWSAWLESRHQFKREGPIFLSFTRTRGGPAVLEMKEELRRLVKSQTISSDAVILTMSGSHGTREGLSALTDTSLGRDQQQQ